MSRLHETDRALEEWDAHERLPPVLADPAALRAMTTGGYRGRYTNDEP